MSAPVNPIKPGASSWLLVAVAWTLVGIPLAWGIYRTLQTAVKIF
ncbi:MAG TPA: hypothetical protein VFI66_06180 [Gemmatimonadales bacterium]|nr:hypothetical protein [Gemmatimonadales bacterium]